MDYTKIRILFKKSALLAVKSQVHILMSKAEFLQVLIKFLNCNPARARFPCNIPYNIPCK